MTKFDSDNTLTTMSCFILLNAPTGSQTCAIAGGTPTESVIISYSGVNPNIGLNNFSHATAFGADAASGFTSSDIPLGWLIGFGFCAANKGAYTGILETSAGNPATTIRQQFASGLGAAMDSAGVIGNTGGGSYTIEIAQRSGIAANENMEMFAILLVPFVTTTLTAATQTYSITGKNVLLGRLKQLIATVANFQITGKNISLAWGKLWNNQGKSFTTYQNQGKSSTSWTNQKKS